MKPTNLLASMCAAAAAMTVAAPAAVAQERHIAEIFMTGANFCPRGSAPTDGQLLAIAQNTALFSLLGTTYGGDGRTTFGLPDLRGRSAIGPGAGPGLSQRRLGEKGGAEMHTLTTLSLPAHTHAISTQPGGGRDGGRNRGRDGNTSADGAVIGAGDGAVATQTASTGGSQPFPLMQPYLAVQHCIALQGIFPSRN